MAKVIDATRTVATTIDRAPLGPSMLVKRNTTDHSGESLAKECSLVGLPEETIRGPLSPALVVVEPPVYFGLEPSNFPAFFDSKMAKVANASRTATTTLGPVPPGPSVRSAHSSADNPTSQSGPSLLREPECHQFYRYCHGPWQKLLHSQEQHMKFTRAHRIYMLFRPFRLRQRTRAR